MKEAHGCRRLTALLTVSLIQMLACAHVRGRREALGRPLIVAVQPYKGVVKGAVRTMDGLSVEQDLSIMDAILRNGNDVTVAAALASTPQRS